MRNQVTRIAITGLFFMLAIASVRAQTPSRVEVDVPFNFSAGKASLKAGTYSIKRVTATSLALRSADGKTALLNTPLTIGSRDFKAGERLVFNKYGNQYFLSQIWLTVDTGRQLLPSSNETKAAKENRKREPTALASRVEVALRK